MKYQIFVVAQCAFLRRGGGSQGGGGLGGERTLGMMSLQKSQVCMKSQH